jgi:hypothetical protein
MVASTPPLSSATTLLPDRISALTTVRPARPAPITHTDARMSDGIGGASEGFQIVI